MLFSILLAILTTAAAPQGNSSLKPQEPLPYRVLRRDLSTNASGAVASYTLSVDHFLSPAQMGSIICQVLQKEKPPFSSQFTVQIFYMLDSLDGPTAQVLDYILADYVWSSNPSESRHHLIMTRDTNGVRLNRPVSYQFDHTTDCVLGK
jgi:hypothetical protein